jgi:hypothetical protein
LRKLFNSDFFKSQLFERVKSPTEVVVGTLRLVGNPEMPTPEIMEHASQIAYMGQDLLNPPSVEGWHNGIEWINSGTLMKRTNFVSELISDTKRSGVIDILNRLKKIEEIPDSLVDECLNLLGPIEVSEFTRNELISHVESLGPFSWSDNSGVQRTLELLQLIVATKEYQFC